MERRAKRLLAMLTGIAITSAALTTYAYDPNPPAPTGIINKYTVDTIDIQRPQLKAMHRRQYMKNVMQYSIIALLYNINSHISNIMQFKNLTLTPFNSLIFNRSKKSKPYFYIQYTDFQATKQQRR